MSFDLLQRGAKVDCHLMLYENELAVIDMICARYDCSRAAVVGAMIQQFRTMDFKDRVKPGRRPGAGRRKAKEKQEP